MTNSCEYAHNDTMNKHNEAQSDESFITPTSGYQHTKSTCQSTRVYKGY